MRTTLEEATNAKGVLRSRLGRPEWLRGIGVGIDGNGYFVKVNVAALTSDVGKRVPPRLGSVRVQVEAVGEITPLAGTPGCSRR
jgi:hypothetical protein